MIRSGLEANKMQFRNNLQIYKQFTNKAKRAFSITLCYTVANRRASKLLYFHLSFSSNSLSAKVTGSSNVFEDIGHASVTQERIKDANKSPIRTLTQARNSVGLPIVLGGPLLRVLFSNLLLKG